MPIVSIKRDWGVNPTLVRIETTDNLSTLSASGYLAAQASVIESLNHGKFEWLSTDFILVDYQPNNLKGYFVRDAATDSLVEWTEPVGSIDLPDGDLFVGNSSNKAVAVTASNDITNDNTGAFTISNNAVTNAKLANNAVSGGKIADGGVNGVKLSIPENQLVIGQASGNGATMAIGGNMTLLASGALTINNEVIDSRHFVPVTSLVAGNGLGTYVHIIELPGGATNTQQVTLARDTRVINCWAVVKGNGTGGDTIQVRNNGTSDISNDLDISSSVATDKVDFTNLDNTIINAAQTLDVVQTDGGLNDSPSVTVFVECVNN